MSFLNEIKQKAFTFTGGRQNSTSHVLNSWTELDGHVRGADMRHIDYARKNTSVQPSSRSTVQVS